jgi:hypothetical protein
MKKECCPGVNDHGPYCSWEYSFRKANRLQQALNRAKEFIRAEAVNPITEAGNHEQYLERLIAEPGCEYARKVLKEIEELEQGDE